MKKLGYRDVQTGHPLPWDVFDAGGLLLLRRGYVIETETQWLGLVERGLYTDGVVLETPPIVASIPKVVFDPFWLWDDIHAKLVHLLRDFEAQDYAEEKVAGIAMLIDVLTEKDADAAFGAILLKDMPSYAYSHTLHVAVMASVLAKKLGWDDGERRDLLSAALTMNVAMIRLQTQLVQQREPLSEEQRWAIAVHPRQGRLLLERKGVGNQRWLQAVELHHRKRDLSAGAADGRPDGAAMAELVRILDVFCAKISPRAYRQALLPPAAARGIFLDERDHPLLGLLIKEVGMYMPGTFVKLENGDVALVVRRGPKVDTPKVVALSRSDGSAYMDGHRRETSRAEYSVKCAIPKEKILHRLNLSRCWGYAA